MEAAKLQTMDQRRAEYAWECVKRHASKDYANLAKSMPAMVMTSGLMPTLAFLHGKGEAEHHTLLGHIVFWLSRQGILEKEISEKETAYWESIRAVDSKNRREREEAEMVLAAFFREIMDDFHGRSSLEYQRATEEALAILKWIRHFADAAKTE